MITNTGEAEAGRVLGLNSPSSACLNWQTPRWHQGAGSRKKRHPRLISGLHMYLHTPGALTRMHTRRFIALNIQIRKDFKTVIPITKIRKKDKFYTKQRESLMRELHWSCTGTHSVVAWTRMTPTGSGIWMLSHQEVELFERIARLGDNGLCLSTLVLGEACHHSRFQFIFWGQAYPASLTNNKQINR